MVSTPACHAGDRGSIPRRGDFYNLSTNVFKIVFDIIFREDLLFDTPIKSYFDKNMYRYVS